MSSLLNDTVQIINDFLDSQMEGSASESAGLGPEVLENHDFIAGPLPLTPQDGVAFEVSDARLITSAIHSITDVNLWFRLENPTAGGAFNGDFYLRLEHGSDYSILINRVGRQSGSDPTAVFGYADNGFRITLDDQATAGDIHTYRLQLSLTPGGPPGLSHETPVDPLHLAPLTGTWAPDGRDVSPLTVSSDIARTRLLSQFNGSLASGTWTLHVSDLNPGGTASLLSWGLQLRGHTAVPEPAGVALATGLLLLAGCGVLRRSRPRRLPST